MSPPWTPTSNWMSRFRTALLASFDDPSLNMLTFDYFGPQNTFHNLAGSMGGYEYRVFELIQQARMNDWLLDLVAAARERRPKNKDLEKIAEDLGLTVVGPRLLNPTGTPLEELIRANAKFIQPVVFREKLAVLETQICWLDIPGGGGTGFLVGPDLVVTNYHVVKRVHENLTSSTDVVCRFDYRQGADGSLLTTKKKVEVGLHPQQWLVHNKPPSQFDWDPTLGNAATDETDCALIRLAEPIGKSAVGGDTADPLAPMRDWIDTQVNAPPLTAGNQVFILQHPKSEPLQLAVGTITGYNPNGTRVRYDANSKEGSSGSPCFDADLQLVALHHARDPNNPPQWNQAVPFSIIKKTWSDAGVLLT